MSNSLVMIPCVVLFAGLVALPSCATNSAMYKDRMTRLRDLAMYDLNCAEKDVVLECTADDAQGGCVKAGASGCGESASYVYKTGTQYEPSGRWSQQ